MSDVYTGWKISSTEFKDGRMFYGIEMPPEMMGEKAFHLISAAPEMYKALRRMIDSPWEPDKWRREVELAYAKAEGK